MNPVVAKTLSRALKIFVILGFPVLGFVYAYQYTGQQREVVVPFRSFRAPPTQLFQAAAQGGVPGNADGKLQTLSYRSSITVVNYWATWCPPCVEEFPAMIELQRQLSGKGVEIVFVSVDDSWDSVLKFLKTNNVPFDAEHMFWDRQKAAAVAWGSQKYPETYVVRRDGWVVEKIIGAQQWTRPVVINYFVELGQKFATVSASTTAQLAPEHADDFANDRAGNLWLRLRSALLPSAFAAGAKNEDAVAASGDTPGQLIHEKDKATLEKLRANIETATQNTQRAEAAAREEERNLKEQRIVLGRRQKEQTQSESDASNIESKMREAQVGEAKTQQSMGVEQAERKKIERQIAEIQTRIADLQKRLEAARDDFTQANKTLNTRVQTLETLQKSSESAREEIASLKSKVDKASALVQERRKASAEAQNEIRVREKRVQEIRGQVTGAEASLKEQKAKLEEFERLLRK